MSVVWREPAKFRLRFNLPEVLVELEITMLRRKQFLISSFFLALSLSACSRSATGPANTTTPPPADSPAKVSQVTSVNFVKASAAEAQVSAGSSGEVIVRLAVQDGYHVNANPPTYPYLKATELTVQAADGLSVGFVTYPTAITKKFSFAQKPLAVYEGEVPIKVMLKAAAASTKGSHTLAARLNVQACDDQVCYPPGRLDISIPVAVK